jgi:hypothetical protein
MGACESKMYIYVCGYRINKYMGNMFSCYACLFLKLYDSKGLLLLMIKS